MWKTLPQVLKSSVVLLIILSGICGIAYPVLVTGIGQLFFQHQADGSLVTFAGRTVGSRLIGQPFRSPGYFWSRPSDTSPFPYNAESSGASNLGPSNPLLREHVERRIQRLRHGNLTDPEPVPIDLVTSSASGLDPDISPAAALYQIPRTLPCTESSAQGPDCTCATAHQGPYLGNIGGPARECPDAEYRSQKDAYAAAAATTCEGFLEAVTEPV